MNVGIGRLHKLTTKIKPEEKYLCLYRVWHADMKKNERLFAMISKQHKKIKTLISAVHLTEFIIKRISKNLNF